MRPRHFFAILSILSTLVLATCSDDSSGPEPETLSHFEVSTPASVMGGASFRVTITATGNQGTRPFTDFSGYVSLSVTDGDVVPSTVTLSKGRGQADAVVTGAAGRIEITAAASSKSGTAFFTVLFDSVAGDPGDMIADHIPDIPYIADARDFSGDHPSLPGMPISHNTVAVVFETGTTVAQANAIISGLGAGIAAGIPGEAGVYPGVLTLKLLTGTHADMETALAALRGNAQVQYAVQDVLMGPDCIPPRDVGVNPPGWSWQVDPAGANWNLERIRAPQIWNFNDAVKRTGQRTPTLIIDVGFNFLHEDVYYRNLTPNIVRNGHGTEVAGILGADFNNGKGIEGINPFAEMKTHAVTFPPLSTTSASVYDSVASALQTVANDLISLLQTHTDIRVVNISLGYVWHNANINANMDAAAQAIANTQGAILAQALLHLQTTRPLPLIVVSAGNDSYARPGFGEQAAVFNSPMTNAALDHGVDCIMVVEALSYEPILSDKVLRWAFSDVGGHVSAPGGGVWVTTGGTVSYQNKSGTSYAAPLVAGLAGYLMALDPALTTAEVHDLLLLNTVPVADASPRIDAWACAMDIDRLRGNLAMRTLLCDIDDQTPDGNQRIDYEDGTTFNRPDGADEYRGDGDVDMSDFRRWRDWLHQVEESDGLSLDGASNYKKRDVNGDGDLGTAAEENVYPIGDFNGDGQMSLTARSYVPGYEHGDITDLEVLRFLFVDPNYSSSQLPGLMNSADIAVDVGTVISAMGGSTAQVIVQDTATAAVVEDRLCNASDPLQVFTVPVAAGGYAVTVNVGGHEFNFGNHSFQAALCGDDYVRPVLFHELDPRQTFLRTCEDSPRDPGVIVLAAYDVEPGDRLLLETVGDYKPHGGDVQLDGAMAVFSSSDQVLSSAQQYRVPGAINAGDDYEYYTENTFYCEALTDISQDFRVETVAIVTVPPGATHLILGVADSFYGDNSDGDHDFGVNISVLKKQ